MFGEPMNDGLRIAEAYGLRVRIHGLHVRGVVVKLEMDWARLRSASHVEISSYRKWGAMESIFYQITPVPADSAYFLVVNSQWLLPESSPHFPHSSLDVLL